MATSNKRRRVNSGGSGNSGVTSISSRRGNSRRDRRRGAIITTLSTNFLATEQVDYDQLEVGDYLSRVAYYQVTEKSADGIRVENDSGFDFYISPDIVKNEMYDCHVEQEQKVTNTELIKKLKGAGEAIFTVEFDKKLTDKIQSQALIDYENELMDGLEEVNPAKKKRKLNKFARQYLLQGPHRTLIGHLAHNEDEMHIETQFGNIVVIDLVEAMAQKNPRREVNPHTIKSLILKGVRYVRK